MKGFPNLLAFALGILSACSGPQSARRIEAETQFVMVDAGENGLCHVRYKQVDRNASCTEVVALMGSELRIPAQEHVVVRTIKGATYEEVSRLIQSLRDAGYSLKVGYIVTR